jgi:LDH2 family malate/lactate/ureidoglycolate dehydrogenase
MKVPIADITAKMTEALQNKGYTETDIPFLIEMYMGGELRGHSSHGLTSFPGFVREDYSGLEEPEVIKSTQAFFMLDAKGHPGAIVGKRAADEAIQRAKQQVIGFSMIKDMDAWLRPGAVAQYIADQGFVAMVSNNASAAVAPPGGFDPVAGTNPIAYALPTQDGPLVVDMATAKCARGNVRLSNKHGTDLPADSFYDSDGNVTLDPSKAWSVMPFGGYKGFALAFLVEAMCAGLTGMDMFVENTAKNTFGQKMPMRGASILVIDPAQTVGLDAYKQATTEYIRKIKATRPRRGEHIRIPGDESAALRSTRLNGTVLDIPDQLWEEIQKL